MSDILEYPYLILVAVEIVLDHANVVLSLLFWNVKHLCAV